MNMVLEKGIGLTYHPAIECTLTGDDESDVLDG